MRDMGLSPGVCNPRPAGQMRPAKEKYAARGEVTILNGVRPAKRVLI